MTVARAAEPPALRTEFEWTPRLAIALLLAVGGVGLVLLLLLGRRRMQAPRLSAEQRDVLLHQLRGWLEPGKDVYKRQGLADLVVIRDILFARHQHLAGGLFPRGRRGLAALEQRHGCLLYTSRAVLAHDADAVLPLDTGGHIVQHDADVALAEKLQDYVDPVSYTHLDVYKRQDAGRAFSLLECIIFVKTICWIC